MKSAVLRDEAVFELIQMNGMKDLCYWGSNAWNAQ